MLHSTMKFISFDNLLLSLCKQRQEPQHSESVRLPGGYEYRDYFPNNDVAKVGINPPLVTLGFLTTCPPYNDGQDLDPWIC